MCIRDRCDDVLDLPNVSLVHLDKLSQITDDTLLKRKSQIPFAKQIIAEVISEFNAWLETRKFAPTIKALKNKLADLRDSEIKEYRKKNGSFAENEAQHISDKVIAKITSQVAFHLKDDQHDTDESIELIKKVFQLQNL